MSVPKYLAATRNDFGTMYEIERVCSLTFCSLLPKVRVVTDYPKTRSSSLEVSWMSLANYASHYSLLTGVRVVPVSFEEPSRRIWYKCREQLLAILLRLARWLLAICSLTSLSRDLIPTRSSSAGICSSLRSSERRGRMLFCSLYRQQCRHTGYQRRNVWWPPIESTTNVIQREIVPLARPIARW